MKLPIITAIVSGSLIHMSLALPGTVIWSDNFNTANTADFDAAPLAGRLGGTLAADARLYSVRAAQGIQSNQLSMVYANTGRVQFKNPTTGVIYNWATGAEAANILADGGMRVEFDFTPVNSTSDLWVAFSIGITNQAGPLENAELQVNHSGADYGILFRNNGGSYRFDNGIGIADGVTVEPIEPRHVVINYTFTSFADGASVQARSFVDGFEVANDSFTWDGNGGNIFMELETYESGARIDNLTVSTNSAYSFSAEGSVFSSGVAAGSQVALLSAIGGEPSAFELVAGAGGADNGKFVIDGNQIQTGSYNFKLDPNGTVYSVRVQGTGNNTAGTQTKVLTFTLFKDDDADGLHDVWELGFAGNLTDLNDLESGSGSGAGSGDYDGDGISDLAEYNYSLGLYPTINPFLADTDGDDLDDNDEINPAAPRTATDPTVADSDKDGLNDFVETNDGTYNNNLSDTGTSGTIPDSDADGSRDGFEVQKGSNPTSGSSRPVLPPALALVRVTDDASTGISTAKTYTHKMSGGDSATINGVTLEKLGANVTPANFVWSASNGKSEISNTVGTWVPASGGVTGPGALSMFGGFVYDTNVNPSGFQTYTLSGLTVGQTYTLNLFIRPWANTISSFRPIDLEFTNGSTNEVPFGALVEDRPGIVLNNGNNNSAYYVSYTYVAETTNLVVKAGVHPSAPAGSGSFHLYGLTNEVLGVSSGALAITGVSRDAFGKFIIDFVGAPNTTYNVTKSSDLSGEFGALTSPLTATTNPGGVGKAIVPASEASEAKEFYRIEQ